MDMQAPSHSVVDCLVALCDGYALKAMLILTMEHFAMLLAQNVAMIEIHSHESSLHQLPAMRSAAALPSHHNLSNCGVDPTQRKGSTKDTFSQHDLISSKPLCLLASTYNHIRGSDHVMCLM